MNTDEQPNAAMQQPRTMESLLIAIKDETEAIDRSIAQLTNAELNQPDPGGWSIKDNLAHLNTWNRYLLLSIFQHQPAYQVFGIDQAEFQGMSEDEINAATFRKNKELPPELVIEQFHDSIDQINTALKEMDFEELLRPRFADDPERRPRLQWVIGNTYGHYHEHRQRIEEQIDRLR